MANPATAIQTGPPYNPPYTRADQALNSNSQTHQNGPFDATNGAIYWVVSRRTTLNDDNSPLVLSVVKSTDGGATKTEMDAAHAPPPIPEPNGGAGAFWGQAFDGTVFHIGYPGPAAKVAGPIVLVTFNTATDTWSAVDNSFAAAYPGASVTAPQITLLSTGRLVLVVNTASVLQYYTFLSGTWTGPTVIYALSPANQYSTVLGANNVTHGFFQEPLDTNAWYFQISAAGALTAPVSYFNDSTFAEDPAGVSPPIYKPSTDELLLTFLYYEYPNPSVNSMVVIRGTPSAAPVWSTPEVVADVTSTNFGTDTPGGWIALNPITGEIYVAWAFVVTPGADWAIVMSSNAGSGWSSPVTMWDYLTDGLIPPIGAGGSVILDVPIKMRWANNRLGTMFGWELNQYGSDAVFFVPFLPALPTISLNDPIDLGFSVDFGFVGGTISIACPPGNTAVAGVPFSSAFPVSGGVLPFSFALTAGAFPTGLALNSATGVLTGIPTAVGTFTFTVQVTDAHNQSAQVTCQIVITRWQLVGAQTLRWQCPSPGRPGRWFPHLYADPVVTHYLVEPNAAYPNDQELFMLAGGAILVDGGDTDAGAPIIVIAEPGSIDAGDERAQKLYVDAMTEADQSGTISAQIRFNNSQQTGPTLILTPTGLRQQFLENIASLMDLSLYRNISVRYTWSGGPDGPRIYAFEPSGFVQPYLSTFFVTQFINLSFPGWKSARRLYPALISNAPVIYTIQTQDGRTYVTTIPSTGGQYRIVPLMVAHGCKDLSFAFQLDGQGVPFAFFPESFTNEFKEWIEPTYIDLAIFRT